MSFEDNSNQRLQEFHLREYESLRKEIEFATQEMRSIETYVLIATGAVWTWLASANSEPPFAKIAWWIPLLFAVLGALKTFALYRGIERMSSYIQKLEQYFCNTRVSSGWETHVHTREVRENFLNIYMYIFWIIMIAISIVVPLIKYGKISNSG